MIANLRFEFGPVTAGSSSGSYTKKPRLDPSVLSADDSCAYWPTPVVFNVCRAGLAPSVTVITAARVPTALGVNVTLNVHFALAASVDVHGIVPAGIAMKSPLPLMTGLKAQEIVGNGNGLGGAGSAHGLRGGGKTCRSEGQRENCRAFGVEYLLIDGGVVGNDHGAVDRTTGPERRREGYAQRAGSAGLAHANLRAARS